MSVDLGPKLGQLINANISDVYVDQFRSFLRAVDALLLGSVVNSVSIAPPPTPLNGDAYLLLPAPTGTWAGHQNSIAVWSTEITAPGTNTKTPGWEFHAPVSGWTIFDTAAGQMMLYRVGQWAPLSGSFGVTPIQQGGTGATTAAGARQDLGAAASGANSDITGISGLTTPLSVAQGGTGDTTLTGIVKGNGTAAFTPAVAGTDYVVPTGSGAGLTGITYAQVSGTPVAPLLKANNLSELTSTAAVTRANINAAGSGANTDITGITGLTTPLAVNQGGTGDASITGIVKGNGTAAFTPAVAGTDYLAPNGSGAALTGITYSQVSGTPVGPLLQSNNLSELKTNATTARTNIGAAASGANADITSLTGLTTALKVSEGGTGTTTLTGLAKGNGTAAFTPAVAGTDYLAPAGSGAALTGITYSQVSGTPVGPLLQANNLSELTSSAAAARANISAAKSGANSDITSITGLSTPLSVAQGGTGDASLTGIVKANGTSAFTTAVAGTDYVVPGGSGASLTGITYSQIAGTPVGLLSQANNLSELTSSAGTARTNINAAASGSNSDITSISGLTTPLSVAQGGTGDVTLNGIVKANGTGPFTPAVAGTDYVAPAGSGASLTGITYGQISGTPTQPVNPLLKANNLSELTSTAATARGNIGAAGSGANADITSLTGLTTVLTVAQGGTGDATITGIVKGNGTSPFTPAVAGTDFLAPAGSGAALTGITYSQIGGTPPQTGNANALVKANNLSELTSTASTARGNISAAASGANSDITSLGALTTALTVAQGGTGDTTLTGIVKGNGTAAFTPAVAGTDYLAPAGSGAALTGITYTQISGTPVQPVNPLLKANNLSELTSTASTARGNLGAAASGANSDITSIAGLTTALTVAQGGTGDTTLTGIVKANGTSPFTAATAGTDYLAPTGSGAALTGITYGQVSGTPVAPLLKANNLSELTSTASTARTNLGLGTAATGNTTGAGAAIPTGPTTTTVGNLVIYSSTTGQQSDSGISTSAGFAGLSSNNNFTASNYFGSALTVAGPFWSLGGSLFTGTTSSVTAAFANYATAVQSTNQSSIGVLIQGAYWTGTASAVDTWKLQDTVGTGTNPTSTLTISHTGSTGVSSVSLPALTLATSSVLTGTTGTGTKLASSIGALTSGDLASWNSTGDAVDSGIAASSVALLNSFNGGSLTTSGGLATSGVLSTSGGLTISGVSGNGNAVFQTGVQSQSTSNQSSITVAVNGTYWNGSASATDSWKLQNTLGNGTNPTSTLSITHTGSSGAATVAMPALKMGSSSVLTGTTGTGTSLTSSTGVLTSGNLISASSTLDAVDSGVAVANVPKLNAANTYTSTNTFYGNLVSSFLYTQLIVSQTATPTGTYGAGSGLSGAASVIGNQTVGYVNFTTGASPTANGVAVTVNLPLSGPTHLYVLISPANAAAVGKFWALGTGINNQFQIGVSGTLTANTTYAVYYHADFD